MASILLVDDEDIMLRGLRILLESQKHKVFTARDGNIGLDHLKANPIDLVITDLRMAPMNGMDFLRNVRKSHPELPAIMLTAFSTPESNQEANSLGVFAYLTKPFGRDDLLKTVTAAVAPKVETKADPTLEETIREYMSRVPKADPCETKMELADEVYWLSDDHSEETLLSALRHALGRKDITTSILNELLDYRKRTVRVKSMAVRTARDKRVDAIHFMHEVATKTAQAHTANNADMAKTIAMAAILLGVRPSELSAPDIKFLLEYEASLRKTMI